VAAILAHHVPRRFVGSMALQRYMDLVQARYPYRPRLLLVYRPRSRPQRLLGSQPRQRQRHARLGMRCQGRRVRTITVELGAIQQVDASP
jgi:hypothetical protein